MVLRIGAYPNRHSEKHNVRVPTYNGTVFTLTGVVELDQNVDTNVTVLGLWSDSNSSQETTAPPYLSSLTF